MQFDPNAEYVKKKKRARTFQTNKRDNIDSKRLTKLKTLDTINNLILDGFIDIRYHNKKCNKCGKICISVNPNGDYNSDIYTETSYRKLVRKKSKKIDWQINCMKCTNLNSQKWRDDSLNFNSNLMKVLKSHLTGTLDDLYKCVDIIRTRDNDICQMCGIKTIPQTKSGWRQLTFNDMHPDKREHNKTAHINDIVCSCLACNFFQNKLSWNTAYEALLTIRNIHENQINPIPDFYYTLPKDKQQWIYNNGKGCPVEIRKIIINRDQDICRLTGVKLVFVPNCWNTISFDRIDSKLPYTVENTQLVCKHINYTKKDLITQNQLNEWLAHIKTSNRFRI